LTAEWKERGAEGRAQEDARWSQGMCRANAGDAEAYGELLHEIGVVLEKYVRRRFGDTDFVEDCVQECLLAIHRARASYDPSRSFRSWMFTIVRHKVIDTLRRRAARGKYETSQGPGDDAAAPANGSRAAFEAADALRALPSEYREALLLTKLEGRSVSEAAEQVGVSVSAMKSRVHRGIARRLACASLSSSPSSGGSGLGSSSYWRRSP
jgi:RNA polymerase sigma-70 factor (ECF subfamily)